jgi:putative membrane protein
MSFAALPNAIFFAVAGIVIFAIALLILLRVLPEQLWKRALAGNTAAALIVAALVLAVGWIVAAAVH